MSPDIILVVSLIVMSSALPANNKNRFLTTIGDREYFIEDNLEANWELAFLSCRKRGLHLISLDELPYRKRLKEYLSKNELKEKSFWTSGTAMNLESWYWLDVGKFFKGKIEGEVENGVHDCLTLKGDVFYQRNCSSNNHFICELRQ